MFNGSTLTTYTKENGLTNNSIWKIIEDKKGNLWFCSDLGVCEYNKKEFIHYTDEEGMHDICFMCFRRP